MQTENSNKPLLGADNNALIALLSINLVVYALIGFLKVVYYLNSYPLEQFYTQIMEPGILHPSAMELLHQPWTLFTYYWIHDGFWVLLTNMIWLTAFGVLLPQVGVMAIAIATVALEPRYRLLKNIGKGIPVWILAMV